MCVLGPLPSVTTCLGDSPGPVQGGGGAGTQCRRKVSQETSLAIESLLHASKPFMFPLPSKKGKPHLEVIYLVIAHYLQLISIRAS